MYKTVFTLLAVVPSVLTAQVAGSASARSDTKASAQVGRGTSADVSSSASVDAELSAARQHGVPERPIRNRVAEGRAKGATEADLAASAHAVRLNLEIAHEALVGAGRSQPSDQETERGANAIERGYTRAQIEAVAKSAPSDRSLVVAFDVLARLSERGVSVSRALAQVQSRLASRASDASIDALVTANADAGASTGVGAGRVAGAAAGSVSGNAAAGAAASGASTAGSATGAVSGAVTGVIKKP